MNMRFVAGAAVLMSVTAISGEQTMQLVRGEGFGPDGQWTLTSQQVAYAETWLKGRRLNCLAGMGSPPVTAMHLDLVRSDGSKLELGFYSQPGYAKVVETRVGKNLCHYQGSEADIAALRAAVSRPQ